MFFLQTPGAYEFLSLLGLGAQNDTSRIIYILIKAGVTCYEIVRSF